MSNTQNLLQKIAKSAFKKNKDTYSCKFCEVKISLKKSTMSNLKQHLIRKHIEKYVDILQINNLAQDRLNNYSSDFFGLEKTELTPFIKFISSSEYPISILEEKNFVGMINDLRPDIKVPSVYIIKNELKNNKSAFKQKLKQMVIDCLAISLFIDIWSYKNSNVIATFARFSYQNKCQENIIIELTEIENQTGKKISEYVHSVITNYGISKAKLTSIVTDNCNGMLYAIADFESRINEEDEYNNTFIDDLGVDDDLITSEIASEDLFPDKLIMDANISDNNLHNYFYVIKPILLNNKEFLHIGCAIHLAELVLKTSSKKIDEIMDIYDRIEKIGILFRKPRNKNFNIIIPKCIQTRWNSRYTLLSKFIQISDNYFSIENQGEMGVPTINKEEIFFIKALHKIHKKFHSLIISLQKPNTTIETLILWVNKTKKSFTEAQKLDNLPSKISEFLQIICKELDKRFMPIIKKTTNLFLLLSFLSPTLYNQLSNSKKTKSRSIILKCKNIEENEIIYKNACCIEEDPSNLEFFLSSDSDINIKKSNTNLSGIEYELFLYEEKAKIIAGKDDDLFWDVNKEVFMHLKIIREGIKNIGCSNGSVEQIFSLCKHYSAWKKNRISINFIETRVINNFINFD